MLSMSRRDNGTRWVTDNSLKFRVNGAFVNGKMTVSLLGQTQETHFRIPKEPKCTNRLH